MDPDSDPDADPDPANFVSDLQDINKNFLCLLLFESTFTSFFKGIRTNGFGWPKNIWILWILEVLPFKVKISQKKIKSSYSRQ
jgi:hypothetical protein